MKYKHLIGRSFIHGSVDCYTFVQDFFLDNFEIDLTNYARPDNWWDKGLDLYMEHAYTEGFRVVSDNPKDWRPADVFMMAIRSEVANHSAINLGDGTIAHHFYGRLSNVEPYRGIWRNTTVAVLRHKDVPDLTSSVETTINLMDDPRIKAKLDRWKRS